MDTNGRDQLKKWVALIQYIFSFVFGFCAILASTEFIKGEMRARYHFIFLFIAILLYIGGHELTIRVEDGNVIRQMAAVNTGIILLFLPTYLRGREILKQEGKSVFCISFFCVIIGCAYLVIRDLILLHQKKYLIDLPKKICNFVDKHKGLLILLLIMLGLSVYHNDVEPRWDGAYVYTYLNEMQLHSVFSMDSLQFCSHISMAYIALNKLLGVIFGDLLLGMSIGNIALFLLSICCMYGILKNVLPGRNDLEYTLLTSIYAISPLILGLVNYNYWDYWVVVLFPVIVYCGLSNKWIWQLIFAFVLCFSKEPAVIAYAFYCIGVIISDFAYVKTCGLKSRFKHILLQKKYWGMLVIGIAWLYSYISLPNWNGVGGFTFNAKYILNKLKVMLILQFNWILVIFACILLVYLLIAKKRSLFNKLLPIILSDFAFIIFSCVFETHNHARYMDTHISALNILALIGLGVIMSQIYAKLLAICLLILLGLSNYATIDPLTLQIFPNYIVGSATMISTSDDEYLSDSMVYNQQYKFFDKTLNIAMKDVMPEVAKNEAFICFPGRTPWFFDGICGISKADEGVTIVEEYWNTQEMKRMYIGDNEGFSFNVYNVTDQSDLEALIDGKTGYYFYIPCKGEELLPMIDQETNVIEKKTFAYGGWEVTRVKFVQQ